MFNLKTILELKKHYDFISFLDLDECQIGSHNCHQNAICTNNMGSFTCKCSIGFIGDGTFCFGKFLHEILAGFHCSALYLKWTSESANALPCQTEPFIISSLYQNGHWNNEYNLKCTDLIDFNISRWLSNCIISMLNPNFQILTWVVHRKNIIILDCFWQINFHFNRHQTAA